MSGGFARRALIRLLGLDGSAGDGSAAPEEYPDDWAREYVHTLDEGFREVAERRGTGAARRWYARQVLSPSTVQFIVLVRSRRRSLRRGSGGAGMRGRGSRGRWWLGGAMDLRQTVRGFLREPRLILFVTVTLALGIGANAALFGVADRLFLGGPEHVERPDELVRLYLEIDGGGVASRTSPWIPYLTAEALREGAPVFTGLALYRFEESLAEMGSVVRPLRVGKVGEGFFDLLGADPAVGRLESGAPDPAGAGAVVISHDLWTSGFGGSSGVVGRTVRLFERPHTIVGVAPRGFAGPQLEPVDAWVALDPAAAGNRNWHVVGRLPPTRTDVAGREVAAAQADAIHRRTDPGRSFQWATQGSIRTAPLHSDEGGSEPAEVAVARLLFALGSLVLLIGIANVVSLLLARLTRRRREVAVRVALGIGRWRLTRLHLVEGVTLAVIGGLASLPVAYVAGVLIRSTLLPEVAWSSPPVSWDVVRVSLLVTLATGLLVAVLPARAANRTDVASDLRSAASENRKGRPRLHLGLATMQVTLSTALLVGAGLFLESYQTIRLTDLGVDARSVTVVRLHSVDTEAFPEPSEQEYELYRRALVAARDHRDVEGAVLVLGLSFIHNFGASIFVPGMDSVPSLPGGGPYLTGITEDYFETLGTDLVRGRGFTATEVAGEERVIVVSESMARQLWPGRDALGECVRIGDSGAPCSLVVGVAEDVHRMGYREPTSMQYYIPYGAPSTGFGGTSLVLRLREGGASSLESLRTLLRGIDPDVDYVEAIRLESVLDPEVRPWRLGTWVLGMAAFLAMLVSVVGVYGVLSYLVEQRRREIGVRMALGASSVSVSRLVVRTGLVATALGIGVGMALVASAARWIEPLLFETAVLDPFVLFAVAAVMLPCGLLACLLPARRASRVDPVRCLAGE